MRSRPKNIADPELRSLGRRLVALQRRAEALGIFTDDRELLQCPDCGLKEDVDATGRLFTYRGRPGSRDTGLRFAEQAGGRFRCPGCGATICEAELARLTAPEAPAKRRKK